MKEYEKLAEKAMLDAKELWMQGYDDETSFSELGLGLYIRGFLKAREMSAEILNEYEEMDYSVIDEIKQIGEKEV
jgi:hypothetical protein